MATNKLSDIKCKQAQAGDKPVKLTDGGGLFLLVQPNGAKLWRMAYRVGGKQQTASFGAYPLITLSSARAKRDDLKRQLSDGVDPRAKKSEEKLRAGITFRDSVQQYWQGRQDLSTQYVINATRAIEMHVMPYLGAMHVNVITRADLMRALGKMDAAGRFNYVRKTRMWCSQVFDWCVEQGHAQINPAAQINPLKAFGSRAVEHFASLPLPELPGFIATLNLERDTLGVLACKLLALTWVRTSELRFMTWAEIDGDVWRIPSARMKMRRDHVVPLSRQACDLLELLRRRSRGDYVFPIDGRSDRPISENAVLSVITRIGYRGRMTGHGWRTCASTWANERGYNDDAIERQLAHSPDDKIRAVYNRAEYLPERRKMLQDWADWLDTHGFSRPGSHTPGDC